jgi:hypothetical protein
MEYSHLTLNVAGNKITFLMEVGDPYSSLVIIPGLPYQSPILLTGIDGQAQ